MCVYVDKNKKEAPDEDFEGIEKVGDTTLDQHVEEINQFI